MQLMPRAAHVLTLVFAGLFGWACASARQAALPPSSPILVHSVFLSGGDAPVAQVVTVFEDGSVRVTISSAPPRLFQLHPHEAAAIRAIVVSEPFAAALAAARAKGRSCCDQPELAITTSVTLDRLGEAGPRHAWFDLTQGHYAPSVAQFISLLNAVGTGHLGHRFLPVHP
jgi:hypothetical protein